MAAFLVGFEFANIQIMKANYPEGEKYNGMNLVEIGKLEGLDPIDTMLKLVKESEGQALQLTYGYSGDDKNEWLIEKLMAHPLCLFETDTLLLSKGFPNPASYGAFPRILGRFVREKKALSLSDAIHRMTAKTARWFEIKDRGEIKPGYFADVVLFNPDTIADNTTIKQTDQKPTGIEKVIVNGEIAVMDGCYLKGKKLGRVLKYE
jgi:N-acyl-D-amino-acid deacylase